MRPGSPLDRLVRAGYRLALAIQTRAFKSGAGQDLLDTLWQRWVDTRTTHGVGPAGLLWIREMADLFRCAAAARLSRIGSSIARKQRSRERFPAGAFRSGGSLAMDLRMALRSLGRRPGFAVVAVVSLTLGIGATSSVFSVIYGAFLRPLPFQDPTTLVVLDERDTRGKPDLVSAMNFEDWRSQSRSFAQMALYSQWSQTLTGSGGPVRLNGYRVSPSLFDLLGVAPELGRSFVPEEEVPGRDRVIILSHGFWRSHFGAARTAVGSTVSLDGEPFLVVGVMPQGFRFPDDDIDFYRPFAPLPWESSHRAIRAHFAIARLADEETVQRAQQEMAAIAARLGREYPATNDGWTVGITPAQSALVGSNKLLWVLLGAIGSVLLIACSNIASLMLSRAREREREFAVRRALGAGRLRMIGELVAEGLLIAAGGGLMGLGLAVFGGWWLSKLAPGGIPGWNQVALGWSVVAFTGAVTLMTTVIFALLPAIRLLGTDLNGALKEGGPGTRGRSAVATRRGLVVVQIGLAVLLTIGAGLLSTSFLKLLDVEPGFESRNLFSGTLELSGEEYDDARSLALFRDLVEGVEALPGVVSAAMVTTLPLNPAGTDYDLAFDIEGRSMPEAERPQVDFRLVSPGYFRTMGIPLVAGRQFSDLDGGTHPTVVMVNQALAERFFPDDDPIGQRVSLGARGEDEPYFEVVGVVGDVHHRGLDHQASPEVFMPWTTWTHAGMTLVVRSEGPPLGLTVSLREVLGRLDPNQVLTDVATMEQLVTRSLADRKTALLILSGVAGLGLLIAAIGIYGLMAYDVACRQREIALRMALGAESANVAALVVKQGMWLTLVGVVLGVMASLVLGKTIEGFLYQLSPADPVTVAGAVATLTLVALVSCWLPARRAALLDPASALRNE